MSQVGGDLWDNIKHIDNPLLVSQKEKRERAWEST